MGKRGGLGAAPGTERAPCKGSRCRVLSPTATSTRYVSPQLDLCRGCIAPSPGPEVTQSQGPCGRQGLITLPFLILKACAVNVEKLYTPT